MGAVKILLMGMLAVLLLVAGWWLYPASETSATGEQSAMAGAVAAPAAGQGPDAGAGPALQSASDEVARADMAAPTGLPQPSTPMQGQLQDIARAYRENSRFPAYSKPLGEDDWELLNPRPFVARETPLEGFPDVSATIEVARYVVDINDPLPVQVVVASPNRAASSVTVSLRSAGSQGGGVALVQQAGGSATQVFAGEIPASVLSAMGAGEVMLVAGVAVAGSDPVSVTAPLKLYAPEARLMYLGAPYVDGANLVIPAHFEVSTDGFYRVRANLFEQESGRPVTHLNAAFMLTAEQPTGLLKVHAQTLRAMQAAGPYRMTDLDITRGPARPGDTTGYGSASQDSYPVAGFSLDTYSDEPYEDPQVQQRLEFLEKLSGGEG